MFISVKSNLANDKAEKNIQIYDNTVTIFLLKLSLIMLQNYGGEAPMQLEATCINWSFSLGETRGDIPVS